MVQRSRFLTTIAPAPTAEAAHAFVQRVRDEFPEATHHCWAFVAGPPGSTAQVGMSDAGEPHGTAGRPMLTVLLHCGVGEIVAVSTRWFGGTKLGTGGLARAYAGGVSHALANLPLDRRVARRLWRVEVEYACVDALRQLLDELDARIEDEDYGGEVRYRVAIPVAAAAVFVARLADLTAGKGIARPEE